MMNSSSLRRKQRGAFTLVELLVVIGIIAILISVLLPTLSSARAAADKTKCLASLHELGNAYKMYAGDNKGAWPVSVHFWTNGDGIHRDKRYHDFIAKYIIGSQRVVDPATGKVYIDNNMNFNGSCSSGTFGSIQAYATHGEFGTAQDPVWLGTMRDRNSVLWGCPTWNRYGFSQQYNFGINNGYAMNYFPLAPNDLNSGGTAVDPTKTARILTDTYAGSTWAGNYFKATQYTRSAERVLLYEAIFNAGYDNYTWDLGKPTSVTYNAQTYTFNPTDPNAILPPQGDEKVSIDWNRHTKAKFGKVRNSDPALNVLFCDGHAATVSTYECYRGMRFR